MPDNWTRHLRSTAAQLTAACVTDATGWVGEWLRPQYQFEEPFIVDSSKTTSNLGITATPIEQAITATLKSYRQEQNPSTK